MHPEVNPLMNYPILEKEVFEEIWLSILNNLHLWKKIKNIRFDGYHQRNSSHQTHRLY
jgi:hypothetical protein